MTWASRRYDLTYCRGACGLDTLYPNRRMERVLNGILL